jgi:hypothetical protein
MNFHIFALQFRSNLIKEKRKPSSFTVGSWVLRDLRRCGRGAADGF